MLRLDDARDSDLARLWPAVNASRIFPSSEEFESFHRAEPWRVRVDDSGRAAVLERWREHLDILGIKGVWCTQRDLAPLLAEVRRVAREHGFGSVLSPLIAEDASQPYAEAGMELRERIVAMRGYPRELVAHPAPPLEGVRLEESIAEDRPSIATLDAACFDEFWRHGERMVERGLVAGRTVVARESEQVIGYTWCTIERGVGTLGRIAVDPRARGRGVGRALLTEALAHMASRGAEAVSLCTQEHNAASRALYLSAGLRELPGRLVLMMQDS